MPARTVRVGPLVVDLYEPEGTPTAALLYSHGFGSARTGEKVVQMGEALASSGAAMLAPDLQGHGESDGEFGSITIQRSIDDLLSVAALPLFQDAPRKLLGGSSFGALTAAWASVDHPELCEGLFLIAPAFGFVERHAAALEEGELEAWRAGEPIRVERDWFTVELEHFLLLETEHREVERLASSFAKPALIVHGKQDETVPVDDVIAFFRTCQAPGLELLLIADGDHRLTDHKERLARELLGFAGLA
ncbi:MAG: alpha/beta hydrolase [Planctomycetota bacterium]